MTFLQCRVTARVLWIGPFAKSIEAKAWLERNLLRHGLRDIRMHTTKAKVLFAAYEYGDARLCVGVFESSDAALRAAGRNGIVIHWRGEDCITPDDPFPFQLPRPIREETPEGEVVNRSANAPFE